MSWKPNEKLQVAILKRIGELLGTKDPAKVLHFMVKQLSIKYPNLDLTADYSVIEDLVIQFLIQKYEDHKLDTMWLHYNFGYFQEDTEELLRSKLGDGYESFINNLAENSNIVFGKPNKLCA